MNKFQIERFVPITKVDDEKRMVYGYASTPQLDSDGEIIKTSALEKALPEYLKFPTIREMHQPKPAGRTKQADVTKDGLYIGAKIASDEAWKLVKEEVYAGFSIGGNVIKRVGNVIEELELVEISLVDVPANKGATIELWKNGKFAKDAEGVYSLSNLMINVKDKISYWKYKGKETKKLEKILELLKSLIAQEALEPEPANNDAGEGIYAGSVLVQIGKKREMLEALDFSTNPAADAIRKGVILVMFKVEEILKKSKADRTEEENTFLKSAVLTDEQKDQLTKEEEDPKTEDKKDEDPEPSKTEEDAEKGKTGSDLQKLEKLSKSLDTITPKKEVTPDHGDLDKVVKYQAGILAKMTDIIVSMEARLAKVENTPAATKSKAEVVLKTINPTGEPAKDTAPKKESAELTAKRARLSELEKLYGTMSRNEFAKSGHSQEAMNLEKEIEILEQKQA
jgi:HK97 family phage prohead protease